ncbi:glutamate-5-semialdehyde dehydrogenase, partial [Candidatus Poribacteria bacterium]|nr:glutamate-5-semialdehyde dehydrogenase [Candidatus Poribacteria bacterium]
MSQTIHETIRSKAQAAKAAMRKLSRTSSDVRNSALLAMADSILTFKEKIQEANQIDLENGRRTGLPQPLMDRLALNEKKMARMVDNLRQVAALPNPIGEVARMWERPNGLRIGTVRVPIGVIGVIYESRPDVTVEVSALCVKSGNGVILRGGSEAIHSNTTLANILSETAESEGIPGAIQFVEVTDRQAVREMISMPELIDLIVPRGSQEFIRYIMKTSDIPVVGHADGICHVYVDEAADLDMAERICINAKIGYKVAVCNAMETLLVHEKIASKFLPSLCEKFTAEGVELRGCEKTRRVCPHLLPATEEDWRTEYLDKILSIRV